MRTDGKQEVHSLYRFCCRSRTNGNTLEPRSNSLCIQKESNVDIRESVLPSIHTHTPTCPSICTSLHPTNRPSINPSNAAGQLVRRLPLSGLLNLVSRYHVAHPGQGTGQSQCPNVQRATRIQTHLSPKWDPNPRSLCVCVVDHSATLYWTKPHTL